MIDVSFMHNKYMCGLVLMNFTAVNVALMLRYSYR